MKKLLLALLTIVLIGSISVWWLYTTAFAPNTPTTHADPFIHIHEGTTIDELISSLTHQGLVLDSSSLALTARLMKYGERDIRIGKYAIPLGANNRTLINRLKSAAQSPIKLTINNVRQVSDLAGQVSQYLSADSLSLIDAMLDSVTLSAMEVDHTTALTMYIPNTYELYWTTSPTDFVQRMKKEHDRWWSAADRRTKAAAKGLSTAEVYTLASIVDKESNLNSEKPTIAGVYLNRLERGIALQADPTVVFASKQYDLRRVLTRHLQIDSPYNTYKYPGLPPGPIYMASIAGLEAVLNAEDHNYIYFCAAPGFGSKHLFATTLTEHNKNARQFHAWLNRQGIK